MQKVLVVRPEPDASRTAARVVELGMWPIIAPVTRIESINASPLDMTGFDAIIVTSPHALSPALAASLPRHVPVHCVGGRAEALVEENGLQLGHVAPNIQRLVSLLNDSSSGMRMLYLSAEDVHADVGSLLAPAGIDVTRIITYRALALDALSDEAVFNLTSVPTPAALFTSVRSLELFVRMLPEGVGLDAIPCVCLSDPIALAARAHGGQHIYVASEPTEDALIAALAASC